jgi:hypothetical protein
VIVRWLHRLAIVAAVTIAVLAITPDAHPDVSIPLAGPLPLTAAEGPACESGADRPYPRMDRWRFGLPGDAGEFEELRLGFRTADGTAVTRTIGSANVDGSAAWLVTDPGWTLVAGTATITGDAKTFTLIEACPATQTGGEPLFINAPAQAQIPSAKRSPRALAPGTDIGATVILGSTLVLAGVLLLVVRRQPRGRHRSRRGRPATQ